MYNFCSFNCEFKTIFNHEQKWLGPAGHLLTNHDMTVRISSDPNTLYAGEAVLGSEQFLYKKKNLNMLTGVERGAV